MVSNPTSPWVLTVDPVLSRNSPPRGRKGWIFIITGGWGGSSGGLGSGQADRVMEELEPLPPSQQEQKVGRG